MSASLFGRLGDTVTGSGGSHVSISLKIVTRLLPATPNGREPTHISYSMTPRENRSDLPSTFCPCTCSGDMYAGVPIISPACVCNAPDGSSM